MKKRAEHDRRLCHALYHPQRLHAGADFFARGAADAFDREDRISLAGRPRLLDRPRADDFSVCGAADKRDISLRRADVPSSILGFAPTAEFTAAQKTDDAVALQIETNPEFYAQYPFRFRYTICYRLEENTLHAESCVENRDEKRMYFALGGHPGINVPLEDGLRFEDYALDFGACVPQRVEFTPDCFVTGRKTPFALQNGKLPLCHALFDQDAIVLKGTTGTVTACQRKGKPRRALDRARLSDFRLLAHAEDGRAIRVSGAVEQPAVEKRRD